MWTKTVVLSQNRIHHPTPLALAQILILRSGYLLESHMPKPDAIDHSNHARPPAYWAMHIGYVLLGQRCGNITEAPLDVLPGASVLPASP